MNAIYDGPALLRSSRLELISLICSFDDLNLTGVKGIH